MVTKIELSFQFGRYKSLELGHVRIFSAQIGVKEFNFIMIDSIQSIGCHMIVFKKSIFLSLRNVYNITYMLIFNFMPQNFDLVQVNVVMLCLFYIERVFGWETTLLLACLVLSLGVNISLAGVVI